MKITVNLEKNLKNVVGTTVSINENIIGKVIYYNEESGLANMEINEDDCFKLSWKEIAGDNVGISSRSNTSQKIFIRKKYILIELFQKIKNFFKK